MERIESFKVNHDVLVPGIYISRIDRVEGHPVTTFDIRCKRPNKGDFMPLDAMHTIEHIGATFFRNSKIKDKVIYFGAMACSTGFYLVVAGDYPLGSEAHQEIVDLTIGMFDFLDNFEGDVPGATRVECGNYLAHDLEGAKNIAREMLAHHQAGRLEFTYS